ncbi:hypothetical protein [Caloramator proteoclasticus]|uniref:Uncharacterized protein n=1 Tax=Caloramator proteoclasticus DSM 10124 TaxID=1121262 RepID=A0A1M4X7X0_9CLOT|nr:hypothetical protein [Caloramator proteoclasticus]SHE89598.1 hypothetical protein SAMN02746091_01339 [Caloramator proteoclasticus DSM 10124]
MLKISRGKKRLLNYLGKPYTVREIDLENCVYLDLKNGYDIEISGGKTIKSKFDIYVWETKEGCEIVEKHFDIKPDLAKVKELLDDIRGRYSNM